MPETIIFALLYAKLKGNNIKEIFYSWTVYPLGIFEIVTLIGQAISFAGGYHGVIEMINKLTSVYLICYLFLILKYELYLPAIVGSVFVILGGKLNDIAISANGGFMPVYQSLSYLTGRVTLEEYKMINDIHILANAETKMKFLTDFIDLGYTILSVGDLCIRVFVFLVIYSAIKKINDRRRKEVC
ncbi:DUF5317 family protein [uncultured Clostridium sp.]|uniref:DUF5317 family protein n=1 Tax=uncultured Clostridium sp. TaxID=59620 RepID=UPI0025DE3574|nr:DUF5317 family protein [uncultured Clostridium sp.]